MLREPLHCPANHACRFGWRRVLAVLLVLLAMPALFAQAHLAFAHHHEAHAAAFGLDGYQHAPDGHDDDHREHPTGDHVRDLRLKYTQKRHVKASPTLSALPPSQAWAPPAPQRRAGLRQLHPALLACTACAPFWARGPPRAG